MQEYLEVGQIVNTVGLKGVIKITPFTDDIKRFDRLKTIYIVKKEEILKYTIQEVRYNKNLVFLKLDGIDTIEEAEQYKGCFIKIKREDAVKLPKNRYFIADLIGLEVVNENQEYIGQLEDIFPTGSNDVYVVRQKNGKQLLLPAIQSVIKKIDLDLKKIEVNIVEGLMK